MAPHCLCATLQAPDVRAAFKDIARTFGGRSDAAAESWMGGLLESNRYLEDVWAG
jgi:cytochrome P450/NADPH-cytochrome P450 reductase